MLTVNSYRILFLLFFLTFIYFWNREIQSMNRGGAEREGDTESETGSRLWAVSTEPDAGLKLMDREIMTWAEVGRLTVPATQAPLCFFIFIFFNVYLFLRQRQSMNGGGSEREGDTEYETGSRLWAVSTEPDAGLKLMEAVRSWPEWAKVDRKSTRLNSSH